MLVLGYVGVGIAGLLFGAAGGFAAARRSAAPASTPEPEPQVEPEVPPPRCSVPGCAEAPQLRALCRRHYGKAYRLHLLEHLGEAELARLAEDRRRQPRPARGLRIVASR